MSGNLLKGWGVMGSEVSERELRERWEAEKGARRRRAEADADWFCAYYLGHYFQVNGVPTGLGDFQHEMLDGAAEEDQVWAFAAPRGHGKTTLLSFALTLRDLVTGRTKFTIYVGPTKGAACERVAEVRQELEDNERLREDFGDLLHKEGRSLTRREDDLRLANGGRLVARGAGQSLRGSKEKQNRPDRVILDDVDKDEEAATPERIDKRVAWFRKVVLGLAGSMGMRVLVVGNIIAPNTLLTWCLKNKRFKSRVYRAIKEDGTPLMPAVWPIEALEKKRLDIGTDSFETEYQNNPPALGARPFRAEWLKRRWSWEQVQALAGPEAGIVVALDLSMGKSARSDYQALGAIQRDAQGRILVRAADLMRLGRRELTRRLFDFCEALGVERIVAVVVESNGFQEWMAEVFAEESSARGLDLPIVKVTHTIAKYDRILKLAPIAEGGRLLFPPEEEESEGVRLLREQFEQYPDHRHDDGPDMIQMAVEESAARRRNRGPLASDLKVFDRESLGDD